MELYNANNPSNKIELKQTKRELKKYVLRKYGRTLTKINAKRRSKNK